MIRCDNIFLTFGTAGGRSQHALRNVTLDIDGNEFITVMGPNGSGKSTLALVLAGLRRPDSGTVTYDGRDIYDERNRRFVREYAGIVFQSPDDQLLTNFIDREVAFALENRGVPRDAMLERVNAALGRFGLTELLHLKPEQLSGGQKQLLALASVFVFNPKLLILDETTSYLDPPGRRAVIDAIRAEFEARNTDGFSVILITQFPDEAALGTRLIVMNDGAPAADGPPEEVFMKNCGRFREMGVGVPMDIILKTECPEILLT